MNEILTQEEIDALLRGDNNASLSKNDNVLSPEEIDAIGEIGNISMGTAATTLSTLLQKKVTITTPEVKITNMKELAEEYPIPFVAVEVLYTDGLEGTNLLILHENDVKVITDLMMGGEGTEFAGELTDLHMSAIGEVMNQMIGSSSTSLSTMLDKNINISPPNTFVFNFSDDNPYIHFDPLDEIVKVNFKMEIEGSIDSYIMQILPISFAKKLISSLLHVQQEASVSYVQDVVSGENSGQVATDNNISDPTYHFEEQKKADERISAVQPGQIEQEKDSGSVNVQPVSFQPLNYTDVNDTKNRNIDLILDVPLEVSVELGRTTKLIKEILELNSGSIIELDRMAGEPVDILVNGKLIAKGEVVVIEDSFGVRITDIVSRDKRILNLK